MPRPRSRERLERLLAEDAAPTPGATRDRAKLTTRLEGKTALESALTTACDWCTFEQEHPDKPHPRVE